MKKALFTITLALVSALLIACASPVVTPMKELTKNDAEAVEKAEECLLGLLNSSTHDEISKYVTESSESYSENLLRLFPKSDYTVNLKALGSLEGHDFFAYTIKSKSDNTVNASGIEVFTSTDKGYVVENNTEVLEKLKTACFCKTCKGTGTISAGGNTCGICGGTGQQYYPAVYYDAALHMWQGQFMACSGCGGAGHTGGSTVICPACHGNKLCLN